MKAITKSCPVCLGSYIKPGKKTCGDRACVREMVSRANRAQWHAQTPEQQRARVMHPNRLAGLRRLFEGMTPEERKAWMDRAKAGYVISHAEWRQRIAAGQVRRRAMGLPCGRPTKTEVEAVGDGCLID